jgi:hypothetical protein
MHLPLFNKFHQRQYQLKLLENDLIYLDIKFDIIDIPMVNIKIYSIR